MPLADLTQRPTRLKVLQVIYEHRAISRAALARLTGLTAAAITRITADLIGEGLVLETGVGDSSSGRKPILVSIRPEAGYMIGVDLSRSGIQAILTDFTAQPVVRIQRAYTQFQDPAASFKDLFDTVQELLDQSQIPASLIQGIGVGAPGPLSPARGVIDAPPNFPAWRGAPVVTLLEERFGIKTYLENDARLCALAEKWFGAGQGLQDFVYLVAGSGVGAGIFQNGRLFRGRDDLAGELGHITIDANGPRCSCGNYGCLELYTREQALVDRVQQGVRYGAPSLLEDQPLNLGTIIKAALAGDRLCREAIRETGRYLGIGVVNAINLFNPEAVFIGRELSGAGDLLMNEIRAVAERRVRSNFAREARILPAALRDEAPALGAATLVLDRYFFPDS